MLKLFFSNSYRASATLNFFIVRAMARILRQNIVALDEIIDFL